jgi:succinate dehydrogenase flavin-adding protein (antitoxin of CptAB toxin-antitoxin module)
VLVIINRNRQRILEQRRGLLEADAVLLAISEYLGYLGGSDFESDEFIRYLQSLDANDRN